MIKINGKEIDVNKFPDGTLHLLCDLSAKVAIIDWRFENNEEMITLMFLTKHLKSIGVKDIDLYMPYIPNARQDRVKNKEDVFTLKYFAEFINDLNFRRVIVLDPHSSVSEALFDNILILNPQTQIGNVIRELPEENFIAFYPDEGAMKRYSTMFNTIPYVFGIKKRDWKTGIIQGLDVAGSTEMIKDNNILIIDDISSRGGTFYYSAKKLKELGANNIYLYITHCEKTIFDGEVFKSGLIKKVYTTDSIFTKRVQDYAESIGLADKIEVLHL